MKISARVNTFNEEDNIGPCLDTLTWADEIVVVDSFSTDRTVEIARRYTDTVVRHAFTSHGEQHNYADTLCRHEWVLVLDADERLSPALQKSIRSLDGDTDCNGYRMARCAWYLGRWIRHSGWYPDWQPRLYRRPATHWAGDPPHEAPKIAGRVGTLGGDLLHYTRRSLREHVEVMNYYTDLAAAAAQRRGAAISRAQFALAPPWTFFRTYFLRLGFLDGWQGWVIANMAAAYVHLRQTKLLEMQRVGPRESYPPPER